MTKSIPVFFFTIKIEYMFSLSMLTVTVDDE